MEVVPLSLSDHDCVGCVRKLNNRKYRAKTIKIRNYSNYNPTEFCKDINAENWHKLYLIQSVNEAWAFMEDLLMRNINKHAPIIEKRVKGRRNLQDETCNNPKKFWRAIKNIFPKSSSKQTSLDEGSTTDVKTVANKFCEFFFNYGF